MLNLKPRSSERTLADRLQLLGAIVRARLLQVYTPDSCIGSTSVAIGVAHALGMHARPLSVEAHIFNEAFQKRVGRERRMPHSSAEVRRWSQQDGSWSLAIGAAGDTRPRRWPGHLVAVITVLGHEPVLWDLSIDQASRVQHDMHIPPIGFVLPVAPDFVVGLRNASGYLGKSFITYTAKPEDRSYEASPNWGTDVRPNAGVIAAVLFQIGGRWE